MKEIFDWVPWFQELASRIKEGGQQTLAEKAWKVDWGPSDPALLEYGNKNIDPFSFFYSLASRNNVANWKTVYRSVAEVFGLQTPIGYDYDQGFIFPTPIPLNLLFHDGRNSNSDLLWNLFAQALTDSVRGETFEDAQEIHNVAVAKLSQTLFLIDPTNFIPFDDHGVLTLGITDWKPRPKITWAKYCQEVEKIRKAFPECECYEIQMFAYLWKNGRIPVKFRSHYQVSTNVYATGEDHWEDFDQNNWVYTGGPGGGEPWPEHGEPTQSDRYPLDAPKRGDIVLVRLGRTQGRGIGVVYKNDYQQELSSNSKLHVLWLNKVSAELTRNAPAQGFTRAGASTVEAFRSTDAYSPTFELLGVQPPEPVKHPLNQILYGPPGTGKTYNSESLAMAIVNGVDVEQIVAEGDRTQFHDFRFDPKGGTGQIAMVTFHQSFSYEDFIEGIRPKLGDGDGIGYELRDGIFKRIANAAQADLEQRYVLIIDEINRGNIPKIFGELITLIEDSRRIGKPDETRVILPYSNKDFGVPGNLYIIGTMNTADRSILLLDTALRRRFHFVEMMPDPEHKCIFDDIKEVDVRKILKAMNERISLLLDREHQIGHTYLFDVKNVEVLADKFQNAIFPLLQEYFYDDWSKIREVLGRNGFVVKQKLGYATKLQNMDLVDEGRVVYERLPNDDPKWRDPDEYKKIYSYNSSSESS